MDIYYTYIETPIGRMIACATDRGICLLEFVDGKLHKQKIDSLLKISGGDLTEKENSHLSLARQELTAYFSGAGNIFTVPLDMTGTDFQKQVWAGLLNIPYGETRSYMQQSVALGDSKKIRAVANANGKNKIAVIVPCHRVIGSDGSLTGYAAGLERKKWLLNLENRQKDLFS